LFIKESEPSLVEHFKFFSEKIGEKRPLFFTLCYAEKRKRKTYNFAVCLACFKFFTLKMKKWWKHFKFSREGDFGRGHTQVTQVTECNRQLP
jgi:hypothetical protein